MANLVMKFSDQTIKLSRINQKYEDISTSKIKQLYSHLSFKTLLSYLNFNAIKFETKLEVK